MLYVRFDGEIPVEVSKDPPKVKKKINLEGKSINIHIVPDEWQTRNDWKSFKQVQRIARLLTATTRKSYLAVDEGSCCSPRFDIIQPFNVGDAVSYGFNGDYYPDGYIVKISPTFQIITDKGHRYLRRKNTSKWVRTGGTWSLCRGHISERNPSF